MSSASSPVGRREFLAASGAVAATGVVAATTGLPNRALAAPVRAGTADTGQELARMMLLVGDQGEDLKLQYLRTLIDNGLPKATNPKKVVIVGAGPAGLASARLLTRAGHTVTLLEANGSRTGGRVKTFRGVFQDKSLHAEAGAMRLPDVHPLVLALADKLGVRRHPFYNSDVLPGARPVGGVPPVVYESWTGEKWTNGRPMDFHAPGPAGRTLIQVNGKRVTRAQYAADPGAVNATFGTNVRTSLRAALDQALRPVTVPNSGRIEDRVQGWAKVFRTFDDYSMHRYLVEQGWDLATIEATGTLENLTSRLHYALIPALIDHALIRPDATYWELEGGTASLTDALTRELGPVIRMGRRMTRLVQTDHGVRVWTTAESGSEDTDGAPVPPEEVFDADYAIVTIPLPAARFCSFEPALSYPKRRAIIETHYDAATKVLLEFKTRFWEQGSGGFVGGGCVSDSPNRFTYFPSVVEGSAGGVVLASYTWSDDAMRWDSLTEGERVYFALMGMADMFGRRVHEEFTGRGISQSWARARYALGETAMPTPGQIHEHHPATRTVEGRVHFAGDHTSLKPAWIEGALESAVRAALEVHNRR